MIDSLTKVLVETKLRTLEVYSKCFTFDELKQINDKCVQLNIKFRTIDDQFPSWAARECSYKKGSYFIIYSGDCIQLHK